MDPYWPTCVAVVRRARLSRDEYYELEQGEPLPLHDFAISHHHPHFAKPRPRNTTSCGCSNESKEFSLF